MYRIRNLTRLTQIFKSSLLSLKLSQTANFIWVRYLLLGRKTFLVRYQTFLSSVKVTWLFRKLEVLLILTAPFGWGYYSYYFWVKFMRIKPREYQLGRNVWKDLPWSPKLWHATRLNPMWMLLGTFIKMLPVNILLTNFFLKG